MQNCISKNLILFSEDELILISDFLKTLSQKKEFSLVRKLLLLADSYANTVSLEEKESQSIKSLSIINKISKITDYVEKNYGKQITVKEIAGVVGLSETAFFRRPPNL